MYTWYTCFHGMFTYLVGLGLGFMMVPLFIRQKLVSESESKRIDDFYDELFIEYKFIQELEDAPMSTLTLEELTALKHEVTYYEIPRLHYKVHMFYDVEKLAFCYFSANELSYKYADIVCRHYVLEHKCKQVYLFPEESVETETKEVEQTGPFVTKKERSFLKKELNKFIYMGKHEKPVSIPEIKPISFLQFKNIHQA